MKSLVKLIISLLIKLAFIALVYAIVMGLTGCDKISTHDVSSLSTSSYQETKVMTETSSKTVHSEQREEAEPSSLFSQVEKRIIEESSAIPSETTVETASVRPTEKPKSKSTSKAPTKKTVKSTTKVTKKVPTKAPTKVPDKDPTKATTKTVTKAPTKKLTNTPTPKPYTYCTCDAEVSCGSTSAGTFHKFTIKGLTAHKLKSGLWEITEASDDKIQAYMKANYPESANHYGVGKLKNKRDYRYKP